MGEIKCAREQKYQKMYLDNGFEHNTKIYKKAKG